MTGEIILPRSGDDVYVFRLYVEGRVAEHNRDRCTEKEQRVNVHSLSIIFIGRESIGHQSVLHTLVVIILYVEFKTK